MGPRSLLLRRLWPRDHPMTYAGNLCFTPGATYGHLEGDYGCFVC